MPPPVVKQCSTCKNYLVASTGINASCHANPPNTIAYPAAFSPTVIPFGIWPPVNPTDWCAQWAAIT